MVGNDSEAVANYSGLVLVRHVGDRGKLRATSYGDFVAQGYRRRQVAHRQSGLSVPGIDELDSSRGLEVRVNKEGAVPAVPDGVSGRSDNGNLSDAVELLQSLNDLELGGPVADGLGNFPVEVHAEIAAEVVGLVREGGHVNHVINIGASVGSGYLDVADLHHFKVPVVGGEGYDPGGPVFFVIVRVLRNFHGCNRSEGSNRGLHLTSSAGHWDVGNNFTSVMEIEAAAKHAAAVDDDGLDFGNTAAAAGLLQDGEDGQAVVGRV